MNWNCGVYKLEEKRGVSFDILLIILVDIKYVITNRKAMNVNKDVFLNNTNDDWITHIVQFSLGKSPQWRTVLHKFYGFSGLMS